MVVCGQVDQIKKFARIVILCLCIVHICASPSLHSEGRGITCNTNQLQERILQKAKKFLLSKQLPDGSWRSETYGLLKSGQSLTPFVLFALSQTPRGSEDQENIWIHQSMEFIRKSGNKEGIHGRSDSDFLDYPNYSTSYALHCFLKFGNKNDQERINKMIQYLQDQQFSEQTGFPQDSPVHGGWGFGINRNPSLGSFVDLAHTRRVLQSLNHANSISNQTKIRSEYFLKRLQKRKHTPNNSLTNWMPGYGYDGGFFSSPTIAYANKGRSKIDLHSGEKYFNSYATATCDGLLSMIALGYDLNSTEIKDALNWLLQNQNWELPAGVPLEDPSPWAESMQFYNLMTLAEAYSSLQLSGNWKKKIVHVLSERQETDGSFINLNGRLMKEDDPLITTTYALVALNHVLSSNY